MTVPSVWPLVRPHLSVLYSGCMYEPGRRRAWLKSDFRQGLSATGRRDRDRRSSSSMATWSTADSGTASSTRSPTATAASPRTGRWAPTGGDGARRRPYPSRGRDDHRGLPRRARPRRRDLGRQRLRRRDVPGAGRPPPGPVGRLVLTNCDTHENFPPGIFKALPPLAKLPVGVTLLALPSASRPSSAPPSAPSRSGRRAELLASWATGDGRQGIRRDLGKVTRGYGEGPHPGRGGGAQRLRVPAAARLGARRPLLPDQLRRRLATEVGGAKLVLYPTRPPSYRSISRSACN